MNTNLTKILLLLFLVSSLASSDTNIFNDANLKIDVETLLINYVISYFYTHEKLNEFETRILHMILQSIARRREETEMKREANTVYWHLRQGR
jgi:hypothetical protein